jgi:Fe-Mn family superoxide dismutase
MMTRRDALKSTAIVTGAVLVGGALPQAMAQAAAGPHTLPPLPYAFDALEPHIDVQTMQIHHGKHHQAYINNLNKAIGDQAALAGKSAEDLVKNLAAVPESIRKTVQNNAGGHVNHSLFWQSLKKDGGAPMGELAKAMDAKFGSLDKFKEDFAKAATTVFGSGWAWLSLDGKELKIEQSPNQDSPLMQGRIPLFGIDVWEHAYYLKYQNRRPDYVAAFFNVINWEFVSERYARLSKG